MQKFTGKPKRQKEEDDGFTEELFNKLEAHRQDADTYTARGIKIPDLPAPGEPIICQYCGKVIYPEDFSEDEFQRKLEFKWHLHPQCKQAMEDTADRFTPGLIAERKKAMGEYGNRIQTKVLTAHDTGVVSRNCKRVKPVREFGKNIRCQK